MSAPAHRVNDRIKAAMVRLVMENGEHVGVLSREEALRRAEELGMDLVEIAPEANPPVCKVLDYGKFKYRQKKRFQQQRHHRGELKEIRIGLTTEQHDLDVKANRVVEFLQHHHKVLISMQLAGRQKAHTDQAISQMQAFAARFEQLGKLERPPTLEGTGRITALLAAR